MKVMVVMALTGAAWAADGASAPTVTVTSNENAPINAICPVCGMKVDRRTTAISIPGDEQLYVGTCGNLECSERVKAEPQRYAVVAKQNQVLGAEPASRPMTRDVVAGPSMGKPASSARATEARPHAQGLVNDSDRTDDAARDRQISDHEERSETDTRR
jgi:hypothetical protein